MISISWVKAYCKDYTKIENYNEAVNDKTQTWECHHRMEQMPFSGRIVSQKYLQKQNMYYNIQPEALIFLKPSEHKHKPCANKYRKRPDLSELNRKLKKGQTPWNKGKTGVFSEELRKHLSDVHKGKTGVNKGRHWYTNGIKNIMAFECPDGYRPGHIISSL